MTLLFDPVTTSVPLVGSDRRFPVRRVYCVGRNYVEHVREMREGDERDDPPSRSRLTPCSVTGR